MALKLPKTLLYIVQKKFLNNTATITKIDGNRYNIEGENQKGIDAYAKLTINNKQQQIA